MAPTPEEMAELEEMLRDGARYAELDDVEAALASGTNVDAADEQGRTALHMASANGHLDIVRRLLSAGADAEARNAGGNTPLHWAALNGQLEVARALMESGAKATVVNNAGRTPMDEALDKGNEEMRALINSFTAPGSTDEQGAGGGEEAFEGMEEDEEAEGLARVEEEGKQGGASSSAPCEEGMGA